MSHPADIHWSRQFPKPSSTTSMNGKTGMGEGSGIPTITKAAWHRGKLYMCGNWQCGLTADVPARTDPNVNWRMWTWNPEEGYRALVWQGSTALGGDGPDGKLSDFLWLPDGRLVVCGGFISLYNRYGHNYFRLHGIAVYDEKEPTANRWKPLIPSVQHNAPPGGQIQSLAYDPNADELWIVGGFEGFRADPVPGSKCFQPNVQVYSFRTGTYQNMIPGLRGGRGIKVKVDARTNPSTVYISGAFHVTGGDGSVKGNGGTGWYSTGFCSYRKDIGFTPFPSRNRDSVIKHEQILQCAADLTYFDQATVHDFLVRDNGDIWIVGSFKEGTNSPGPLHAIARWDPANEVWTDPTGCGGFGRDAYSIEEGPDGKIYIAGSFGGDKSPNQPGFPGFLNPAGAGGADIHLGVIYDPATNTWEQMGSGLGGFPMPVCRLTVVSPTDVIFYGTFRCVGRQPRKDGAFESQFLARWNPHVDFTKECPPLPEQDTPYNYVTPVYDVPTYTGVEHWDRGFPDPEKSPMTGKTGLYCGLGVPHVTCLLWVGDILYMGGAWECERNTRWHVWCYNKERGYWSIAQYKAGSGGSTGFCSIPKGMKWHDGRLWLYGASEAYKGIAIYDPATNTWSPLISHFRGMEIKGNGCTGNPPVEDIQWDTNGDLYIASPACEKVAEMLGYLPGQVTRITPDGEYFPMGKSLCPLTAKHPLSVNCILLDTTQTPTEIIIGGAFAFVHFDTGHKNFANNVARWDYATQDWCAFGHGTRWHLSPLDEGYFPNGLPGLPGIPLYGCPTFKEELAGTVRVLMKDKAGVIYAMGSCNILDDAIDVAKRVEDYGICKYDPRTDLWTGATKDHGVNNDVWQATWLDDTHMLISGSFLYTERFANLNNIAIFDTQSGELLPVGGGLFKDNDGHVTGQEIFHCVREDGFWFGGNFKFAGVEPKARSQAPVSCCHLAHFDPLHNLDPNGNMHVNPIAPVKGVKGWSSEQRTCDISVSDVPEGGVVTWYQYSSARWNKCGTGPTYKASFRVKCTDLFFKYAVSVTLPGGIEGSKIYAIIPIEPVP